MRLLVWDDGRVMEAAEYRLSEVYVYQRIHTLGYRAYNLSRHIILLREASAAMFGFMSLCRVEDAERIIIKLLELCRVSPRLSCTVVMRLDPRGSLSFQVEPPTLYAGCALRAKRLDGVLLATSKIDDEYPTSLTLARDAINDSRVIGYGDVAICYDDNNEVISTPWRPIFAVYHNKIYTPAEFSSVEYIATAEAIAKAGFELEVHTLPIASLKRMDELFMADVMGITSLLSINHHRLLFMITSQVADNMQPKP